MNTDRVTRPKLERSAPVRTLFSTPGRPTPAGPGDVGRGVQLGYTVIEDYLRQGQELAKAMVTPGAAVSPPDPQQMANRLVQYATDFAGAWLEYLQTAMSLPGMVPGTASPATPVGTAGPFDIGRHAAEPARGPDPSQAREGTREGTSRPALTLDVQSSKRVNVTVELKPVAASLPLVVHELRSGDGAAPRISEVSIVHGDRLVVRLRVPDGQPPGTYSGLIVDTKDNLPRGTMTVQIEG
jgi:hypothetical protein